MSIGWGIRDPTEGGFWIENPSRSGGVAANGQEQNVITLSARQRAQWTVPILNANDLMDARRFIAKLRGKAVSVLVPVFEPKKGRAGHVHANYPAWSTTIQISLTAGPAPEHGRHFSIANNNRVYCAIDITAMGSGVYEITFQPPLRQDADGFDTVHWDDAVCEMNLADDSLPILPFVMRFATPEFNFVETF